jgi:hypothetical protein
MRTQRRGFHLAVGGKACGAVARARRHRGAVLEFAQRRVDAEREVIVQIARPRQADAGAAVVARARAAFEGVVLRADDEQVQAPLVGVGAGLRNGLSGKKHQQNS